MHPHWSAVGVCSGRGLTIHESNALPDVILVAALHQVPGVCELQVVRHCVL